MAPTELSGLKLLPVVESFLPRFGLVRPSPDDTIKVAGEYIVGGFAAFVAARANTAHAKKWLVIRLEDSPRSPAVRIAAIRDLIENYPLSSHEVQSALSYLASRNVSFPTKIIGLSKDILGYVAKMAGREERWREWRYLPLSQQAEIGRGLASGASAEGIETPLAAAGESAGGVKSYPIAAEYSLLDERVIRGAADVRYAWIRHVEPLAAALKGKRYVVGGFRSGAEYIAARSPWSRRTTYRYIREYIRLAKMYGNGDLPAEAVDARRLAAERENGIEGLPRAEAAVRRLYRLAEEIPGLPRSAHGALVRALDEVTASVGRLGASGDGRLGANK